MPGDEEPEPLLALDEDDGMAVLASNDEWAFRQADRMQDKLPGRTGKDRSTEGEVFDQPTLMVLHRLLTHGVLKSLDFPVSTGKEANVFRGTTPRGGHVAVKIFRVNTSTFKHVLKYIQGDERFQGVTGDKRGMVHAWCQKEYRNLRRMRKAGCSVPEPVKATANVLVMEHLGKREGPWPTLKQMGRLAEPSRLWDQLVEDYVRAYNVAGLVHADLSEYNVLLEGSDLLPASQRARLIDVGQAVLWNHPMAGEFMERDLKNLVRYFRGQGLDVEVGAVRSRLQSPQGKGHEEDEEE